MNPYSVNDFHFSIFDSEPRTAMRSSMLEQSTITKSSTKSLMAAVKHPEEILVREAIIE
jgi:hypothetical protein